MQILHAEHKWCLWWFKHCHVFFSSRIGRVRGMCLPSSKNPINDKTLAAIPVKNPTACQEVTRVCLPRAQFLPRAKCADQDRVIAGFEVNVHFHPVRAYSFVGSCMGIVRE